MSVISSSTLPSLRLLVRPERPPSLPAQVNRARRIALLMIAISLMSIADLGYTLTYMSTSGMFEMNPIAHYMLDLGGARQLIMYKLLCIALCCGSIYLARRNPRAEFGAWTCTGVMLILTIHWINFNSSISQFTQDMALAAMTDGGDSAGWVKLEP